EPFVTTQAGSVVQHVASLGIHIAPVPTDSVLATLHFSAFLSQYQQTQLSVDGITFSAQPARPSDCIALAQMDTSAFTLRTLCGDVTLLRSMSGQSPFEIVKVEPNPASDKLGVTISNPDAESVMLSICDALGRTWHSVLVSGAGSTLDISALPEGTYFLRASSGRGTQARNFVVRR
ncbi:MAG: T9SS type A sorting domain-containing protein, partial [Bacteroidota bacterium]|nr:T9SS type A sorting domain-containing protein [Bacteroidota bacterium]MDP4234413.1 T9SS type A sorting domain-containing protein [Bacteroidota bacterium]MDP4243979.1 T9SS type A sorting domain-containing protein [Bacteroidota bacterium]MDP4288145.1 T9SS type A sorting domain-containing protein [Bacteroidota bacterium]